MFKSRKKNNKLQNIIYIILIFYIIFITDSAFFQVNSNPIFNRLSQVIIIIASIFVFFLYMFKNKKLIIDTNFQYFLLSLMLLFFTLLLNFELKLFVPVKMASLIFAYFIIKIIDVKKFIDIFMKIIVIIALYSLFVYLFRDQIKLLSFLPKMVTGNGVTIIMVGLTNIPQTYANLRNWGPFWEPSAYQIYLNLTLILILFYSKYSNKTKIIYSTIIITTLFTVLSTAGILTLIMVIAGYTFHLSDKRQSLFIQTSIIMFFLVMIYFFFRNEELSNAIFFDKLDDVSSEDRFRTIKYGFKAFKLRPIFGHGSKYMNVMHSIAGHEFSITNTYVANFVAFGSLFGLFVVVNLKRFVDSIKTSMISKLILYITFLLLFSSLSLIHSPLFSVLMFLRLNEEKKELVFNEEKNINSQV